MSKLRNVGITLVLLLSSPLARGQSASTGTIIGTVTDPTGALVVQAEIEVQELRTGITRTVTTDDQGNYRVPALPPGKFRVQVQQSGFRLEVVTDVVVEVSQVRRLDFRMSVGELSQNVMVSASPVTLNTETSTLGEVISQTRIAKLPLNGREFIALSTLVPGAQNLTDTKLAGTVTATNKSKGYVVAFNGARASANGYNVDGVDSSDINTNQLIASPPLDAIQEFRASTSTYSAQYGRAAGGVLDIITKSGTNDFHGTLYEYHRNEALDALPFFYTGTREDRPGYLRNQFGGSIGGPIYRKKTFFFASPEWLRAKLPGQLQVGFAPTAKERAGDLTESINPFTRLPVELINPYTSEIISPAIVPQSLITDVGKNLMALWPEPNFNAPGGANYRIFRGGANDASKVLTRIDHHFSDKNWLTGTFIYGKTFAVFPRFNRFQDYQDKATDKTVTVGYTRIISSTLVNDFRFSRNLVFRSADFSR